MSKQQYTRLTLVLAIPLLIFSFWLAQQDSIFNRGQFVECDMSTNSCIHLQMSLSELYEIENSSLLLKYASTSSEKFLGLKNFNFPVRVFAWHTYKENEVDISSLISGRALEEHSCTLQQHLSYNCKKNLFSFTSGFGRIEFINADDYIKFKNINEKGQSYFKDYLPIRIAIGLGFFLFFSILYLIISWLIHFIIYGTKKS